MGIYRAKKEYSREKIADEFSTKIKYKYSRKKNIKIVVIDIKIKLLKICHEIVVLSIAFIIVEPYFARKILPRLCSFYIPYRETSIS